MMYKIHSSKKAGFKYYVKNALFSEKIKNKNKKIKIKKII